MYMPSVESLIFVLFIIDFFPLPLFAFFKDIEKILVDGFHHDDDMRMSLDTTTSLDNYTSYSVRSVTEGACDVFCYICLSAMCWDAYTGLSIPTSS